MALNRSEIELLIKARNEAQGAFDQLNKQVASVTGESVRATAGMTGLGSATKTTGAATQATGVAVGLLADRLARGLVSGFRSTIEAANRLDAGLIGLSSVAKAFGGNADRAKDAAVSLAKDGLLSVGEAATGLKNLLASGFNLDQATQLMLRFKDSASFGRQAALSFGQAVTSATEGIKNGNSILVDNAGVTKNLSQILVEAGHSAQDLSKASSDSGVRMALFNGILKETVPQLGDTERFLGTAAGKQAQFNAQIEIAQQKIGKQLQPALAALLDVLQPVVTLIGTMAPIIVPVGVAIAGLVAPILATKAAAALGVTSVTELGAAFGFTGKAALVAGEQVQTASVLLYGANGRILTVKDGLTATTTTAATATRQFGLLGSVVAAAGVAFAGWQLGTWIGQVTGATDALQGFIEKYGIMLSMQSGNPMFAQMAVNASASAAQTEAIKKETIALAEQRGIRIQAKTVLEQYAEAVAGLTKLESIRLAKANEDVQATRDRIANYNALKFGVQVVKERTAEYVEVQKKGIDAELALGKISQETANIRKAQLDQEAKAYQVARNRLSLNEAIRIAEKGVQDDIKATGMSLSELLVKLKANEDQTKKWLTGMGVSGETIEFLDAQLKKQTTSTKAATEAAEKAREAHKQLMEQMAQLGLVTKEKVLIELAHLIKMEEEGTKAGVPYKAIVKAIYPELAELARKAKDSGIQVSELAGRFAIATQIMREGLPNLTAPINQIDLSKIITGSVNLGDKDSILGGNALKQLGITSQKELERIVKNTEAAWTEIVRIYGKKSPEATAAYKAMIEAQLDLTRGLPNVWRDEVFPGIKRTVETLQTAVQGSFAQMLLGAKGFKDGFLDIWQSIKAGVMHVLSDILAGFLNGFLKGILGAMAGKQGAFSGLIGGMFGGGGFGGFGGIGNVAMSLGGHGATAGSVGGSIFADGSGTGAMTGGGGFGGLGSFATSTLGGSLIGGGVGAGVGFGIGNKYGTGKGILGGVGSGALTGLALGGPIGMGIGAIAGLIGGVIGGAQNNTKKQREQFAKELGFKDIDQLFAALKTKAPDQADELRNRALNVIGKKDTPGNQKWMEDVIAAFDKAEKSLNALASATQRYQLTWEDMDKAVQQSKVLEMGQQLVDDEALLEKQGYRQDAVLRKQAESYSALIAKARQLGLDLPEALKPILMKLMDMGLLLDENGEKLVNLGGLTFAPGATTQPVVGADGKLTVEPRRQWIGLGKDPNEVHLLEGGAAGGVWAKRPGLVLFGEGGEQEVGGPAGFFEAIFRRLGIGGQNQGQAPVVVNFEKGSIQVMDAAGLEETVDKKIIPAIIKAVGGNKRQARTDFRAALGVT